MPSLNAAILESFQVNKRRKYLVGACDLSYADLGADVGALGSFLQESGLRGERLLLVTKDSRALLTAFFAALLKGATAVILDPKAPVAEISTLISAANARGIVADRSVMEALESAGVLAGIATKVPVPEIETPARKSRFRIFASKPAASGDAADFSGILAAHAGEPCTAAEVDDEAIAYILFTSGTTSKPKGVMISHRALYAQMQTFVRNYALSDGAKVMNLLPFHHTDGLTQGAVMCLLSGSTFVRPYPFTPDILPQMMDDLYKYSVSHLVTVPSVLALTKSLDGTCSGSFDYPEFRFVISTAAYLDTELWRTCEERFGIQIVNVYGLTETVCETMYCGPGVDERRVGTVGKPIDSLAKIVDQEGNELGDGEDGELLVGGPHIMSGYFNNPEATDAVLCDGWLRTGDVAKRDADGFYYIVGRNKDLIISGGMNIYPEDVNGVLRSIPGVLDAVTFGLPDPMWGERAVSCVTCDKSINPSVETIVSDFLDRASRQTLPREILKLDRFPRGPAGKVVMSEVKALFVRQLSRQEAERELAVEGGDVPAKIYSIAAGVLHCPPDRLSEESQSETVRNWTSLSHVEMTLALEETFDFKFTPREIMKFRSLGDAIEIVRNRIAA